MLCLLTHFINVINPMEQETLLDPGPVKLAPCWESRHAPTDELNFKTATPKGEFDGKPPVDSRVLRLRPPDSTGARDSLTSMSWLLHQLVYNPACLVAPGGAWMGSCIAERGGGSPEATTGC
ncbi:equilibrative nucleoside transporter 3 [Trichonephila clavipes]|nr:equilibrative nucleoside transporter 3 [Trichonephila clavipes]